MLTASFPQFLTTMRRQVAESIYSHLVTVDKALWNIDFILKANDPNLDIPRPNSYSQSAFQNIICAAEPYRWKNLPDYSSVKDQLYDNFLDPRGRYVAVFSKYSAYLIYSQMSDEKVKYLQICLDVKNEETAERIKALDGSKRIQVSGTEICYDLNNGAGFEMVKKKYSCNL